MISEAGSALRLLSDETVIMSAERQQHARQLVSQVTPDDISKAQALIDRVTSQGVRLITIADGAYPENLKLIFNRPPFIWVRGHLAARNLRAIDPLAMQVAAIIARFAAQHLRCVARVLGGEPAVVTSVPSTEPRRGRELIRWSASAVAGLVIGRVIDPDWNDSCRLIWDQARETPFSFGECCLCPH